LGDSFEEIGSKILQNTESMDISNDGKTLVTVSKSSGNFRRLEVWKLNSNNWVSITSTALTQNNYDVQISGDGTTIGITYYGFQWDSRGRNPGGFNIYKIVNTTLKEISKDFFYLNPNIFSQANLDFSKDGNRFIIGFPKNNLITEFSSTISPKYPGVVKYYEFIDGKYKQVGVDIEGKAGTQDQLGYSVSISDDGNIFAISAPDQSSEVVNRGSVGSVKVYRRIGSSFILLGNEITEQLNDVFQAYQFGAKIFLNEQANEISIRNPGFGSNPIQTYLYSYTGTTGLDLMTIHIKPLAGMQGTNQNYTTP
jgi:hypothetical protein